MNNHINNNRIFHSENKYQPTTEQLLHRLEMDEMLLKKHPENKELLERRIETTRRLLNEKYSGRPLEYDKSYMLIRCMHRRKANLEELKVGEMYKVNRETIYIDPNGISYGEISDLKGRIIGVLKLSYFKSL